MPAKKCVNLTARAAGGCRAALAASRVRGLAIGASRSDASRRMALHCERVRTARYPRLCAPYRRERRVRKAKRAHRQHRVAPQFRCTGPWFETRGFAPLLTMRIYGLGTDRDQSVIAIARSARRSRAESFSVALLSWPQAARMSRPRGVRTGEA